MKREPIQLTLRYSDILFITLAWCASWIVAGTAFYVLLLALWPVAPMVAWPICIGIYAIAWDIGFVSFITPSGLGIREAAIVALFALAFPLPTGLASIMALISRLVSTLAEAVCVSIAYLSGGKQELNIQQDSLVRPLQKNDGNSEKPDGEILSTEKATYIPVEGVVKGE
jgi:uncharacterized membrane protein YbhN (UPF0104 family)